MMKNLTEIINEVVDIIRMPSYENYSQVYNEIEDFWVEETEQRKDIDYDTNWEFLAMKRIYELLSTLSTSSTLSTQSTLSFDVIYQMGEPGGYK